MNAFSGVSCGINIFILSKDQMSTDKVKEVTRKNEDYHPTLQLHSDLRRFSRFQLCLVFSVKHSSGFSDCICTLVTVFVMDVVMVAQMMC